MRVLPALLSHLWSSTAFLVLVLAVIFLMRNRLTAGARFSLALIGIVKFAIPGSLVSSLLPSPDALPIGLQALGGALRVTPAAMAAASVWPRIVVVIWLAVALALILRFALTRHRLILLSVRTALPPRPREVEALARARRRVGVRRSIDIARSALPEAPAVLRTFRPLLVLPAAGCDDLSDDELESLLVHECAHVARHDNLIARIESVICALFWFHPLIWIAQRVTVIERERACDEVVAASADERETYLAALSKFCHAAIVPRLPGVSCMATAKLKERMDHVMNYPSLKAHAVSPRRVTVMAAVALVLFTLAAGIVGSAPAFAGTKKNRGPYAIKIIATRAGEALVLRGTVSENKTQQVVADGTVTVKPWQRASITGPGLDVAFDLRPDQGDRVAVDVTIQREGSVIQRSTLIITPRDNATAAAASKYTGDPISLTLEDGDLRDVIGTFGKITGMEMRMDAAVQGKVSVNWHNVPWDQAFDSMLKENGLTYKIEGKTIHVTKMR
jgi:beta-lactamase regulating signal transducer with metallopeptidase domain